MQAVLFRNRGRLAIKEQQYGLALVSLEEAMHRFRQLRHRIEDAEAGAAHAEALAGLGEHEDAQEEIRAVQKTLEQLGSVTRASEIRSASERIKTLRKSDLGR